MNKSYLTAALTLTCLLGLGIKAHAQDTEGAIATIPFEFVAGGQILPAGTYTVSRTAHDAHSGVTIRSYDNVVFMLPVVVDGAFTQQPRLSFGHVGGEYFLSKVETPGGTYTFAKPRTLPMLAQKKDHSTMPSPSGN
jgi:hypothetical protein